jgi:hypothetical protein
MRRSYPSYRPAIPRDRRLRRHGHSVDFDGQPVLLAQPLDQGFHGRGHRTLGRVLPDGRLELEDWSGTVERHERAASLRSRRPPAS